MNQWTDYFPPLNLWNYSTSWSWFIDAELESFFEPKETNEQNVRQSQSGIG